jgi:hypothetical protein
MIAHDGPTTSALEAGPAIYDGEGADVRVLLERLLEALFNIGNFAK